MVRLTNPKSITFAGGLLVDVARQYLPLAALERTVDAMAFSAKMNVLHLHVIKAKLDECGSPVSVRVLGGDDLAVAFERDGDAFTNVQLTGPAEFVYSGQIEI